MMKYYHPKPWKLAFRLSNRERFVSPAERNPPKLRKR